MTADLAKELGLQISTCPPTIIQYGHGSTQATTATAHLDFSISGFLTGTDAYLVIIQNERLILGLDWMIQPDILLQPKNRMVYNTDGGR